MTLEFSFGYAFGGYHMPYSWTKRRLDPQQVEPSCIEPTIGQPEQARTKARGSGRSSPGGGLAGGSQAVAGVVLQMDNF